MSSFLQNILTAADKKENADFNENIEIIKKEIIKLKSVINDIMKDKYVELEPFLKPDEILVTKNEKLITNIKNLKSRIENQVKIKLSTSLKELQSLSLELKEYNYSVNVSSQLLEIQKGFESIENYEFNKTQYAVAAITLVNLQTLIIDNCSDIQKLHIYLALKEEYYKKYENFLQELITSWQEKICWSDLKNSSFTKSFSLEIQCESDLLTDIIQALDAVNKLKKSIEIFSTNLLQYFIKPIIKFSCSVQNTDKILTIEIVDKKQLPPYKTVLDNLQLLFEFLYKHFNIIVGNNEYFLTKLSIPLFQEFSNILNSECISKIIPTSTTELSMFKNTVSEIEEFKNYLLKIKFIDEDKHFLSEYTYNIDKLYIDKKCERLLEMARNIMKKDLHDSFKYKPEENLEQLSNSESMDKHYNIILDRKLSKHLFTFPECQISKSAQEIVCLIEEILKEACDNNDKDLLRLFYTSRNIFEMYGALLPEIHKSFLETIPQQVALFHNNCFYLAHCLLTLTYKYQQTTKFSQNFCMIYIDQVLLLRQVGSEHFLKHMKYQRDIIFGILRESGLSSIGQVPELPATTERALRQCVRQLELLKTVWIEILPIKVYCRALGCIVNDMVDDLSSKVINVEDIPADVASELVALFNMVIKRIPQIFPNAALIEQSVPKWRKLKELIIILGASLKEIEDRWADGKGPLANEFSSQHVKQLIRALFQNTDRRSNLLSKIKEK